MAQSIKTVWVLLPRSDPKASWSVASDDSVEYDKTTIKNTIKNWSKLHKSSNFDISELRVDIEYAVERLSRLDKILFNLYALGLSPTDIHRYWLRAQGDTATAANRKSGFALIDRLASSIQFYLSTRTVGVLLEDLTDEEEPDEKE